MCYLYILYTEKKNKMKHIIVDNELLDSEKVVLIMIESMSKKWFFASNEYIAQTVGKTSRTVSRIISSLEKKGYIYLVIYKNYKRKIFLQEKQENTLPFLVNFLEEKFGKKINNYEKELIQEKIRVYGEENIQNAVENYIYIRDSQKYFYNYNFRLVDFLSSEKGLPNFQKNIEILQEKYKDKKQEKEKKKQDPVLQYIENIEDPDVRKKIKERKKEFESIRQKEYDLERVRKFHHYLLYGDNEQEDKEVRNKYKEIINQNLNI